MKVSTDGCIFGALISKVFTDNVLKNKDSFSNLLDIGTGTGLLSLMLAQKNMALIDAVEIDISAFRQASDNFLSSPFAERISILNKDILKYNPGKKYDGIICNPPFFEGDLKSADVSKNAAKHDTTLTLKQLLKAVKNLLKSDGLFAVLLPFHRIKEFEVEAFALNIFLQEKILVRHTLKHPYFRGVLIFSLMETAIVTRELTIKNSDNQYTPEFIDLLKDYYLYL